LANVFLMHIQLVPKNVNQLSYFFPAFISKVMLDHIELLTLFLVFSIFLPTADIATDFLTAKKLYQVHVFVV